MSDAPFTEEQVQRYSRHIILPNIGGAGQRKLIDSVHAEVGSRTTEELEAERDELILGLLELRAKAAARG